MSGMSLSFLLHVASSVHQPNSHLQKAAGAWGKVPDRQPWGRLLICNGSALAPEPASPTALG